MEHLNIDSEALALETQKFGTLYDILKKLDVIPKATFVENFLEQLTIYEPPLAQRLDTSSTAQLHVKKRY